MSRFERIKLAVTRSRSPDEETQGQTTTHDLGNDSTSEGRGLRGGSWINSNGLQSPVRDDDYNPAAWNISGGFALQAPKASPNPPAPSSPSSASARCW